ncbi:hypothetical protein RRG08_028362 [Elysia crispata]|uniref:Uncharacterized protein n=1 Tax=Elysia crispata TaxID=231223 RepID=A0AAE1E6Z4_9GAST|nr:hypothetical protein RRG08_028362 [Elysia crispata]
MILLVLRQGQGYGAVSNIITIPIHYTFIATRPAYVSNGHFISSHFKLWRCADWGYPKNNYWRFTHWDGLPAIRAVWRLPGRSDDQRHGKCAKLPRSYRQWRDLIGSAQPLAKLCVDLWSLVGPRMDQRLEVSYRRAWVHCGAATRSLHAGLSVSSFDLSTSCLANQVLVVDPNERMVVKMLGKHGLVVPADLCARGTVWSREAVHRRLLVKSNPQTWREQSLTFLESRYREML